VARTSTSAAELVRVAGWGMNERMTE